MRGRPEGKADSYDKFVANTWKLSVHLLYLSRGGRMIMRRISYGTSIECSVFVGIKKTGLAVCFLMEGIAVIVMQKQVLV